MEPILEKIYKSTLKFLVPLTPQEAYATIVNEAKKLVNAHDGTILLNKNGVLERVYASNPKLYKIQTKKNDFMYAVYKTKRPKILSVAQIEKLYPEIKETSIRSDIIIPLSYQNTSVGVLSIMSQKDHYFTGKHLATLKLFGPLATLVIKKTQLYDQTKEALEKRDLFISMASHELKTPLTTIYSYIQLMQLRLARGGTFDAAWVNTIANEVTRLIKLVKGLLQLDQIKTGQLHYAWKKCSIRQITKRVINDFQVAKPGHTIVFTNTLKAKHDTVRADYDKILQVLYNVLNNAAKFSPSASKITLSLDFVSPYIVITVKDGGKGIAKKDLPNIFEGFYRGSNSTHEGMGLGLYLTKNIIDKHKGKIEVSSIPKKGTTVKILLPQYIGKENRGSRRPRSRLPLR